MAGSNNWAQIGRDVAKKTGAAVGLTAVAVAQRSGANTSRVDTGDMKSGWETQFTGPFEARITNTQNYAIHHEYGTRHIAAAPMLIPAIEATRAPFESMLRQCMP